MRKSASEFIRDLEVRIARLEKQSGWTMRKPEDDLKEFLNFCKKFNLRKLGDHVWDGEKNFTEHEDLWTAMMNPYGQEGLNHVTRKGVFVLNRRGEELVKNKRASKSASTKKKAGPGAGVELCLSGDSRKVRCLDTYVDENRLSADVGRDGLPVFKGRAGIFDLTIASYYHAKHINGIAAVIEGKTLTGELNENIADLVHLEERELSDVASYSIASIKLENSIEGGGYSRGSAPDHIDISGEIEIEIEFEDGHYILEEIEFESTAKTSDEFQLMWNILDDDEDEEY